MKWINLSKRHKLSKLTQEEIGHLNSPKSIKRINFVVQRLLTKKKKNPEDFTENFYQTCKEQLI